MKGYLLNTLEKKIKLPHNKNFQMKNRIRMLDL